MYLGCTFGLPIKEDTMTKSQEKQKAIELYKAIANGKIQGFKIPNRIIKMGSITFIPG